MEKINNVGYIGSVSRGTIVKYGDIILREIRGGGRERRDIVKDSRLNRVN